MYYLDTTVAGCDAVAGTGTPIEKVNINPFTVSEVLRLYLLSTSRNSVQHVRCTYGNSGGKFSRNVLEGSVVL